MTNILYFHSVVRDGQSVSSSSCDEQLPEDGQVANMDASSLYSAICRARLASARPQVELIKDDDTSSTTTTTDVDDQVLHVPLVGLGVDFFSSSSFASRSNRGSISFQTQVFTYEELSEATNNFDTNKELGRRSSSAIYHGKLRDGRVVAIKRFFVLNMKRIEEFANEISVLSYLRHKNMVPLYGCASVHSREHLLVYEFLPNGNVADHLHGEFAKDGLLPWHVRMRIAIESAEALAYLHEYGIVHRNVNSSHIILDNNFHVKVAGVRFSHLLRTDIAHASTAPGGNFGYVDPEYYHYYQLTNKSDVYSFGVILIELITSRPAVGIRRPRHEINLANMAVNRIQNQALHSLVDPYLGYDTDGSVRKMITLAAELAFRCLQNTSERRPCMAEVLEVLRGIDRAGLGHRQSMQYHTNRPFLRSCLKKASIFKFCRRPHLGLI